VTDFAAIVLAGGAGRRLGGRAKPELAVGTGRLVDRVVAAAAQARRIVLVGPDPGGLPPTVSVTCERPPGAGPVAAVRAGLSIVDEPYVVLLAADLPFVEQQALEFLLAAVRGHSGVDAAVAVDDAGRRQYLLAAWRSAALAGVLRRTAARALRELYSAAGIAGIAELAMPMEAGPPVWFDCDTPAALEQARRWAGPQFGGRGTR